MEVEGKDGDILFTVAAERFDLRDAQNINSRETCMIDGTESRQNRKRNDDCQAKENNRIEAHPKRMHFG